jgi:hypothetical protein
MIASRIALEMVGPQSTWIYVVEFEEPPPRPDGGSHGSLRIPVLMSGEAIRPTRSKPARTP